MRKFRLILLLVVFSAFTVTGIAANIKGCLINDAGEPIEFATIVLLNGDKQVNGTTSDVGGCFTLSANAGNYNVRINFVGFTSHNSVVDVKNIDMNLGNIILVKSGVMMKEVTVKGSAIRREADRYIMSVEYLPTTIGKDGADLLSQAPGVWISDDKISINGKGGTKVYINDRELKMSNEQLMAYLKSLTAENVSKVEIIPNAGAEFSADMKGGIIKITLKKNRGDGVLGNVGLRSELGSTYTILRPNARINYKTGKWAFSASTWWDSPAKSVFTNSENTIYKNSEGVLNSSSLSDDSGSLYGGGSVGAFYDIDSNNTIGAEVEFYMVDSRTLLKTNSDFLDSHSHISTLGRYNTKQNDNNINASFNYIHKIDSVGSTLKFLTNYIYNNSTGDAYNSSSITNGAIAVDSIFRNDLSSKYNVLNAALDLDKVINANWKIKGGTKYTLNNTNNHAYYDYLRDESWVPSAKYNYDVRYNENIFALYAIATATYGKLSVNAGLRGEYTKAVGEGSYVNQNYFDLFPNANINYSLSSKGDYSISAQYSRTIDRPSFWALSPVRQQISDYSYQVGNPNLKAAYVNSATLTLALAYKYSLSAGYSRANNAINQTFISDSENPKNMNLTYDNLAKNASFYISAYAPIDITKWWNTTIGMNYVRSTQQENPTARTYNYNFFSVNGSMNFTLPYTFFFEVRAFYQNRVRQGRTETEPIVSCDVTLKKTFSNNKWVASIGTRKMLSRDIVINGLGDDFTRVFRIKKPFGIRLSVTYNFNVGKKFNERKIESIQDASRMKTNN